MNKSDILIIRGKKGFIIDMDGVLYHGNKLLPGVIEFVNWLKQENKKFLFLTNSSARSQMELKEKLNRMGIDVSEDKFYTSGLATASFLSSQKPKGSAYVIGESGLKNALYNVGYTMNDVNPDYVVISETRDYNYDKIEHAINLVIKGARLIGTNPDVSGPVETGIAPATKALTAPIELATGKKAYYIGKPNPYIMRHAIKTIDCHSEESIIIGDRMDTDIIAGIESGIDTLLVLSGIVTKNEEVEKFAFRPNFILPGVKDIVI
jgi:NagD protein